MVKDVNDHTIQFTDKIDGNTLESCVAAGGGGLIFDSTDERTLEGATVLLNIEQLRLLRAQIDRVIGEYEPTEEVGTEPDPEAERSAKDKLADDITSILDLFRENPLTTKGDFLLFDGNAFRVMEGLKNVLEGRNV